MSSLSRQVSVKVKSSTKGEFICVRLRYGIAIEEYERIESSELSGYIMHLSVGVFAIVRIPSSQFEAKLVT